jgi:hypothetical protein
METKSKEGNGQHALKMAEQHDVKFIRLCLTPIPFGFFPQP